MRIFDGDRGIDRRSSIRIEANELAPATGVQIELGEHPCGDDSMEIGGKSTELWAGLLVRAQWRGLFADLGYALFTRRWDTGRDDLPSADGTTDGAFTAELAVRWMLALGAAIPVRHDLAITIRLEWRIRYYDERGGQSLRDDIVHGTQEIRPLFGVTWRPCW